ncbi:hypothetical protein G9A89_016471 [Geosiphon pyriformis]|nr:hypothetical protein G9A89_016471 [Geosiphon pyriformis]
MPKQHIPRKASQSIDGYLTPPVDEKNPIFSQMLDITGTTVVTIDATVSTAGNFMGVMSAVGSAAGQVGAMATFATFVPLISDVLRLVEGMVQLYQQAEHNKRICGVLLDRVFAAEAAVKNLQVRKNEHMDFFKNNENYRIFQNFRNNIEKIKRFIEDISQIKGLRKFTQGYLQANAIKKTFKELTKEFDGYMQTLQFTITIEIHAQQQKDGEVLDQDINELKQYLSDIEGGITDIRGDISLAIERIDLLARLFLKQPPELSSSSSLPISTDQPLEISAFTPPESQKGKVQKRIRKADYEEAAFKELTLETLPHDIYTQVTILKKLQDSKNIIRFYGLAKENEKLYLVTEWAEHRSLKEYYTNYSNLYDWRKKIEFALDICRGLSFLQAVNILHHDIRSENVLVLQTGKAKIANFGLSRGFSQATKNIAANVENVRYMAPEKIIDRRYRYDCKCEIYSFGMLLWEIYEKKIPYSNILNDIVKIREIVVNKKMRETWTSPNTPSEYKKVYNQAVHDDPSLRPSISDIFKMLVPLWKNVQPPPSPRMVPLRNNSQFSESEKGDSDNEGDSDEDCSIEPPRIPLQEAIREHKKKDGDKKKAWDAFQYYKNIGDIQAKYWVGYYLYYDILKFPETEYSKEERLQESAKLFKESADECGMQEAQLRYGYCLWHGHGVEKDIPEAINYFERSADNGNATAMYNVGNVYYNGIGVEPDIQKGEQYLIMGAYNGQPKAREMCDEKGIKL